ncbi:MAG: sigma-54-dependent Fis family transcriptional regulator [Deltaproteobacteria bacterium]|nr:sigma-54-dependent Fis family transcriptional regulator [Deltaproteobacteria bacterium]
MSEDICKHKDWTPRILVVEDDTSMAKVIRYNLEEEGCQVDWVARGDEAIKRLPADSPEAPYDLVLSDVKLPGADGMAVLAAARRCHRDLRVVLVTAFGSVEQAIDALEEGASDYISKPFKRKEFKARVARALEQVSLSRENQALRERISAGGQKALLTASPRMQEIIQVVERVAPSDATVLISGESGTGKELVARLLHDRSNRADGPFIPVNCAALPRDLLESELFGHEAGAFTGAGKTRPGRFEQAHEGSLFLDEIGELPLELQAKILRVLDEGIIDRLGGRSRVPVNVRVVAATNRDMEEDVRAGRFRSDLFHRLQVVPIELPPLRRRPEDIELLARHFVAEAAGDQKPPSLAPALLDELRSRPWPGNVRELKNLMTRMVLLRRSDTLDLADLAPPGTGHRDHATMSAEAPKDPILANPEPSQLQPGSLILPPLGFSLPGLEEEIINKALAKHRDNQSATARYLGIPRHVLLYRLEKYAKGKDL